MLRGASQTGKHNEAGAQSGARQLPACMHGKTMWHIPHSAEILCAEMLTHQALGKAVASHLLHDADVQLLQVAQRGELPECNGRAGVSE